MLIFEALTTVNCYVTEVGFVVIRHVMVEVIPLVGSKSNGVT